MFTTTMPMAALVKQGRWKVEFCSAGSLDQKAHFPIVQLCELFRERRETLDPQAFAEHDFHYIGLEHIQSVTGDLLDHRPRKGREIRSRSKVFRQGDLLYGRLRPSLNKVFVADGPVTEGICSGEFYVLIPDGTRLLPQFAQAVLSSRLVQDGIGGLTSGTALPRLHLSDLLAIEVPLPSLKEQQAIEYNLIEEKNQRAAAVRMLTLRPVAARNSLANYLESGSVFDIAGWADTSCENAKKCRLPDLSTTAPQRRDL